MSNFIVSCATHNPETGVSSELIETGDGVNTFETIKQARKAIKKYVKGIQKQFKEKYYLVFGETYATAESKDNGERFDTFGTVMEFQITKLVDPVVKAKKVKVPGLVKYTFTFNGKTVKVNNIDTSGNEPIAVTDSNWEQIVFDNISDTGKFDGDEMSEISDMLAADFMAALVERK